MTDHFGRNEEKEKKRGRKYIRRED